MSSWPHKRSRFKPWEIEQAKRAIEAQKAKQTNTKVVRPLTFGSVVGGVFLGATLAGLFFALIYFIIYTGTR